MGDPVCTVESELSQLPVAAVRRHFRIQGIHIGFSASVSLNTNGQTKCFDMLAKNVRSAPWRRLRLYSPG